MPPNKARIQQYLRDFSFRQLFIEELGWDNLPAATEVTVEGQRFALPAIAHKRGMVAYQCPAPDGGRIPEYALRRKIEQQIIKTAHEHLIVFTDPGKTTQIWQWVKREPGKPAACREHTFNRNQSGEALMQKLQTVAFSFDEEETLTLVDVAARTRKDFDVERVTKHFYDQFKKENAGFFKFVEGIDAVADREWYASVMLNRISISGERAGCLTLVIDDHHGANVPTRFALSPRTNLDDAIADLSTREGTSSDRIGYVNLVRNAERPYARQQHPHVCDTIKAWAQAQRLDAVVWTALPSNFAEVAHRPFSVEAAILYLKAWIEPAKSHALEYLQKAPPEVVTPVRTAAIQAGLIAPIASENQPETEDPESADDADGDEDQYPWGDVDKARHNQRLQRKHPPGEADKYRATAKPCPKCGKASTDLAWFYFESPKWTWENLCGRAGWMTVCDPCHAQVAFFLEVMN